MRIPLPESIKRHLRPLPQMMAVALVDPREPVSVRLLSGGRASDVSGNNVIAALRPLTVAVGLRDELAGAVLPDSQPQLHFSDRESNATLGVLDLRHTRSAEIAGVHFAFFEIERGAHRCVPWPIRSWNTWLQNRATRTRKDPYNFSMEPDAVQQTVIFYTCPRPVVLVSVDDGSHSNVFPMDLIGPVHPDRFTLALRSTSQSIETMKRFRKVAISNIAGSHHQIAYRLGAHHRNVKIDWDALPFRVIRSQMYSLPVPDIALRTRELEILHAEEIGSHTFFVTRVVSDVHRQEAAQFCHTGGIYQSFRRRQRRPFVLAAQQT